ncbi:MAG TPA: FtsH protease activity modulator HflK [Thiolinea sp.]|nr:FtsH protease activity modulator HflK [Thiolinea sp.]
MPWNEPGGNGNQKDPWTGKNRNTGSQSAEELISQLNKKLGGLFGGGKRGGGSGSGSSNPIPGGAKGVIVLAALLVAGWLFSGFYTVDASQQGLVTRFGAYTETTGPGLHWHLPYPIEAVMTLNVAQNRSAQDRSSMLTKDENIIDIAVTVQYRINNAENYAFKVDRPDDLVDQARGTLYQVMRSATREVVGRNTMDFILLEGREQIAINVQPIMQKLLDSYQAGLQIIKVNLTYAEAPQEVKDAFDDANRAREDANRYQNEADTYAKAVLPEARGQAARLLEEANAYQAQTVARAEGDASRFNQLSAEYLKAPAVTRERLYLETMETVMADSRKVVIDSQSNNLLYLPLDQLSGGRATGDIPAPAQLAAPLASSGNSRSSTNGRQPRNLSGSSTREVRP